MKNKGFAGLSTLLIGLIIAGFIAYFSFKQYLGEDKKGSQQTKSFAQEAGIDTSSQINILESSKARIQDVQRIKTEQAKQTE
jgi:predicted transcriptional regulator